VLLSIILSFKTVKEVTEQAWKAESQGPAHWHHDAIAHRRIHSLALSSKTVKEVTEQAWKAESQGPAHRHHAVFTGTAPEVWALFLKGIG
jgi:hypothetical protein